MNDVAHATLNIVLFWVVISFIIWAVMDDRKVRAEINKMLDKWKEDNHE